ncbi:MAG: sensor histidine kinase [Gemmatimonadaceae bacterium]|nr:sensor histidine kinase [Gemmatimonadaceae bacterium]
MNQTALLELDAAILQAAITSLAGGLCFALYVRYERPHFAWFGIAWTMYLARLLSILAFMVQQDPHWLFWHQVFTGETALALLWTALGFSQGARWRQLYWLAVAFPPLWAYVAIYRMDNFLLAAGPAVLFLSVATFATGAMFLRYRLANPSSGASMLALTFLLWGLHHLDYPILRARGVWTPWGYYLDILFLLGACAGILLLVNHELADGLRVRTAELEHLQRRMVRQHEEERRRLSLALHDETAQVFAALKLELGAIGERVDEQLRKRVTRAVSLVDTGLRQIRDVTHDLRPSLLDDLGLLPALRSLVGEFASRREAPTTFDAPDTLPVVSDDVEVALFRALQEGLSNVGRHAPSAPVRVVATSDTERVRLTISDSGPGFDARRLERLELEGHLGLAGMRERIVGVGGDVLVSSSPQHGVTIAIEVPRAENSSK